MILAMAIVMLAGCASGSTGESDVLFTLTDMTGREIEFDGPVTRVVALTPSDAEILFAIGAGGTLVGRGAFCDYPEEVLSVPEVGSGADTNLEEVIRLEPQVVLMSTMGQTEEQVAQLESAGIKCVVSDAHDIAGVYTAIEMIGKMVGREAEASALIEDMKATFAGVENDSTGDGSETIYFEVSSLQWGDPWTAGSGTFMDEIAGMLGLTNVFEDVDGWGQISQEQVVRRDPDYIVTIEMYFGEGPPPDEEIMSRDGWQGITAVQNGTVFNIDSDEISRPGPRLADAAVVLFELIY